MYFDIRNILPKSGTFLLGHPVYAPPPSPSVGFDPAIPAIERPKAHSLRTGGHWNRLKVADYGFHL